MKIGYIASCSVPSRRADSIQVMRMCDAFAGNGHEVSLIAGNGGGATADVCRYYGTRSTFRIGRWYRPNVPFFRSLLYLSQVVPAELFQHHTDLYYGRDAYILTALAVKNVPIVYEAHMHPSGFRKEIESRLFRTNACNRIVFISDALKQIYVDEVPNVKRCDLVVAHDGADAVVDGGSDDELAMFESSAKLRVAYVGHLYDGRGIDLLLRLAKRFPEIEFHFVGGDQRDIDRWKTEAAVLDNAFFHGFFEPHRCAAFLRQSDIVAAPFQRRVMVDGGRLDTSAYMSPLKIFEYMASGSAILTSDLPALREVLTNDESALLCDPNDDDAWANAISRLCDHSLRQRLGRQAKETLEQQYTWCVRARRVLEGVASRHPVKKKPNG